MKPDVDEFFSPLFELENGDKKFSKLTKPQKTKFVKECLEDDTIEKQWNDYQDYYKSQMDFFNDPENFAHQQVSVDGKAASSDLNLYKLFVERSFSLLKQNGMCGLVVPSGIYSDLGSKGLRTLLFENNTVQSMCSFINRRGIFEDIHRQFKFCTLVFKKSGTTTEFRSSFYVTDVKELQLFNEKGFMYPVDLIRSSSPHSFSVLECKNSAESQILSKLFSFPLLSDGESWNFKAMREFDMTNDSKLFRTSDVGLPLYEGKMINHFEHQFADPRYWIPTDAGRDVLCKKEQNRIKRSHGVLVPTDKVKTASECYRLAWRTIANAGDNRTLISTVLPPNVFLGNSLNYLNPSIFDGQKYSQPLSYAETMFVCGILNSFVIDFILRHRVSRNINIFYLMETPIPPFDSDNPLHRQVVENSAKLICTTEEFSELADELGVQVSQINDEQKLELTAHTNALVAKIYGLTPEDLKYILDTFPIADSALKERVTAEFSRLD